MLSATHISFTQTQIFFDLQELFWISNAASRTRNSHHAKNGLDGDGG
jgi:hypothetical protein